MAPTLALWLHGSVSSILTWLSEQLLPALLFLRRSTSKVFSHLHVSKCLLSQFHLLLTEYLGVVTNSLETSSQGALCTDAIKGAVAELEEQLQIPTCCKKIEKAFQLCDKLDPDNDLDVANLFESLAGNFEGVVQYNKDNRDSSKSANITVDVVCDVMTSSNFGSPMDRYAAVNSILLNSVGEKCLDYKYEKFLKDMRSVSWNSSASEGGTVYSCLLGFLFPLKCDHMSSSTN